MTNTISISTLLDYIAYSPTEPRKTSSSLRGVWTPIETGDAYLCARCYGRLLARGVSLVTTAVWNDTAEPVEWVAANKRETAGVCANCFPAPVVEDDTDEGAENPHLQRCKSCDGTGWSGGVVLSKICEAGCAGAGTRLVWR